MQKASELTEDAFPAYCRAHGLKCTAQRLAVFSVLRGAKGHPSVDEVWSTVRKAIPTVTRESVYRILNEFSEIGLAVRLDALSSARYDTWLVPHAHFICERCGCVVDYALDRPLVLPPEMPAERHHLELRVTGLCTKCAKSGR